MRVVIDGLSIENQDASSVLVDQVLQAWHRSDDWDAVHLLLPPDVEITTPRSVTVWRSTGTRSAWGQRITQSLRVPRLCRTLDADVLLSMVPSPTPRRLPCPHVVLVHDDAQVRQTGTWRDADATICLSEHIKDELQSHAAPASHHPFWLVAPPALSNLADTEPGSPLQVVDDDLAAQLERHRSAWRRVADGLRLALIDAVASTRWRQRRFAIRPVPRLGRTPGFGTTIVPLHTGVHPSQLPVSAAVGDARRPRPRPMRHVTRSGRYVVVASVATLAVSGLSAASMVIASAPPVHPAAAPHEVALPSPIASAVQAAPITSAGPAAAPSATTVTTLPASSTTNAATGGSVPTTTPTTVLAPSPLSLSGPIKAIVPSIVLPGLTIPQLPLRALCPTTTTSTTAPALTLPSLCTLSVGSVGLP